MLLELSEGDWHERRARPGSRVAAARRGRAAHRRGRAAAPVARARGTAGAAGGPGGGLDRGAGDRDGAAGGAPEGPWRTAGAAAGDPRHGVRAARGGGRLPQRRAARAVLPSGRLGAPEPAAGALGWSVRDQPRAAPGPLAGADPRFGGRRRGGAQGWARRG